jgi:outer membrane protein TolC
MKFSGFLVLMALGAPAAALAQPAPAKNPAPRKAPAPSSAPTAAAPTPAAPAPASTPSAGTAAAEAGTAAVDADINALIREGGLTATAAAARAVKVSPEVRRRAADVAAANAAATKAQLVNVPRVAGTLQYVRLSSIDSPELAPGFSFPVLLNSYSATAEIAVPLSDYVFRIPDLVAGARAALEAARTSQQSTEVAVAANAKIAYYEWLRALLQRLVAQRSVSQVEATLGQVRSLVEVQRASRADLLRVEALLAQARQTASQLSGVVALRQEALRLTIGASPDEPLTVGEDIRAELELPALEAATALAEAALKRRVEVRTLDAGIRARTHQRDAEKAGRLPRLSAFGQANYANPNQRIVPSREEFDFTWQVGVQLTWNLNDFLTSKANIDGFDAEVRGLEADRDRLSDGIRVEVVQATTSLEVARSAIDTTAQGLAAAEESYRVRKELLALERATAVELVDAESEVTRARIAALSARVDLRVALVQLARATGADAP